MKKEIKLFKIVIALLFIASLGICLISFMDEYGNAFQVALQYATGPLIFGGFISAYVVFAIINSRVAPKIRSSKIKRKKGIRSIGLLNFFSNGYAMIFDVLMALSFILGIVFFFVPKLGSVLWSVFAGIFFFSLNMHAILNGVNFRYIFMNKGDRTNEKV